MSIIQGLIGFMLLTTGSQVYWFFAAIIGFLIGDFVAVRFFNVLPGMPLIYIDLGAAAIALLLTLTARKPALILIGFLAGMMAADTLPELFNLALTFNDWFLLLFGGLIGGLFVYYSYTYAVVILSAIIGAQLVAVNVNIGDLNPQVMFFAVLILGIGIQLLLAQYATPSMEK